MKESYAQTKLAKDLRDKGYVVWVISDSYTSGIPDLFIAKDGEVQWAELKVVNEGPGDTIHLDDRKSSGRGFSRAQAIKIFELQEQGVNAYGLCYVSEASVYIRVNAEQMTNSYTYEEFLKLPEVKF